MRMALRLMEPSGRLAPCPDSQAGSDGVFPLLIEQSYALSQEGRVQVLEIPRGVAVDTLGATTPRWRLEGTFGARPRRIRGKTFAPHELAQDFRRYIGYYFEERRRRTEKQSPLLEMVFDDLDRGLHWVVVPMGLPDIRMSAREPVRVYWSLELKGVRPATSRPPQEVMDLLGARLAPESPGQVGAALPTLLGATPAAFTRPAPSPSLTPPLPEYPTTPESPHGSGLIPQDPPPALEAPALAQEAATLGGALLTGEVAPEEAASALSELSQKAEALEAAQNAYAAGKGKEASLEAQAVLSALDPASPLLQMAQALEGFLSAWDQAQDAVKQATAFAQALADGVSPEELLGLLDGALSVNFPQSGARELLSALRRAASRLSSGEPLGLLLGSAALAVMGRYAPPEARHALTRARLGVDWALRALGR